MADPIATLGVEHVNIVHDDYDATVEHYQRLFGGRVVFDRIQPTWHACLMEVGGVLFEIFVPVEFFLHTRYGPHQLGIEYHVADIGPVRETLIARGIRVARDLDVALHTHPADCHGVSLEFFEDSFHTNDDLLDRPLETTAYWRDEHPLGFTGLHGCTVAVRDLAAARRDFQALLRHEVVAEVGHDDLVAHGVQLRVAGAVLELIAPTDDGPLKEHLLAHGEGIRSTVFGVRDVDRVRAWFDDLGVDLVPGTAPGSVAIPAAQHRGVIVEFASEPNGV